MQDIALNPQMLFYTNSFSAAYQPDAGAPSPPQFLAPARPLLPRNVRAPPASPDPTSLRPFACAAQSPAPPAFAHAAALQAAAAAFGVEPLPPVSDFLRDPRACKAESREPVVRLLLASARRSAASSASPSPFPSPPPAALVASPRHSSRGSAAASRAASGGRKASAASPFFPALPTREAASRGPKGAAKKARGGGEEEAREPTTQAAEIAPGTVFGAAACGPAASAFPQRQALPSFSPQQHPHDQHARHGTHGIVARGVREREKNEDGAAGGTKRGRQSKTTQQLRDDRPYVCFSCKYRDSFLSLSPDRLVITGHKGWSSAFATHCAEKDRWYFEVEVLPNETANLRFIGYPPEPQARLKAHWRVGWACRYQKYDSPIGGNAHSFAVCGASGELPALVTGGLPRPVEALTGNPAELQELKEGDVIGCFLALHEPNWWLPDPRKDQKLYEFLHAGIMCSPDAPPPCVVNKGAWIEFSINGQRLGRVFEGLIGNGAYHPAVSLYMGAKLKINPGPDFAFPPDPSEGFQPCSEMRRPYIP